MSIINIFLANLFLLTTSNIIIRDLDYNNYYTENMTKFENKIIPEGSQFFIRFPSYSEKEMKFNLIIPQNITIFPIYISEFPEYPNDTTISNVIFSNVIKVKEQKEEDNQYIRYSYDINKTQSYQVLYFQNGEALNYISFLAYSFATNTFSNLPINQGFSIYSLKAGSSYYLKLDTSESDENGIQIETSSSLGSLPNYELDMKCFTYEPSEYEMTKVDYSWKKNISYKVRDDNYKEYRTYEYGHIRNPQFCVIHIYNKNDISELYIYIKKLEDYKLPTWAIVLIAVLAVLLIIGLIYIIRKACISCDDPNNRATAAYCCAGMCVCAWCLANVAEAGKTEF